MQGRFEPITIQTKPPQLELSAGSLKSLLLRWEDIMIFPPICLRNRKFHSSLHPLSEGICGFSTWHISNVISWKFMCVEIWCWIAHKTHLDQHYLCTRCSSRKGKSFILWYSGKKPFNSSALVPRSLALKKKVEFSNRGWKMVLSFLKVSS